MAADGIELVLAMVLLGSAFAGAVAILVCHFRRDGR